MEKFYADEGIIHDDNAPICRVQGVTEQIDVIITIYFNKKSSPKLAERCRINVSLNIMIVNQSFYKVCRVQNGRLVLASIKVREPIV